MLKDMRITKKFPLVMITFALISALTTGVVAYYHAAEEMQETAKGKLFSLLESRELALQSYFHTIQQDSIYHSQSKLVGSAIREFSQAWNEVPEPREAYLKKYYIKKNPYPAGQKSRFLAAEDRSLYSNVHRKYHIIFTSLLANRSFYDIFLIDPSGNIIYSVVKENDYAANLNRKALEGSGFAAVFRAVKDEPEQGKAVFSDFSPYAPSGNQPAGFIASPILGEDGEFIGALGFQIAIDKLNQIMQATPGMGETGETYLVGKDLKMRSDSRFFVGRSILKTTVDTLSVERALNGEEGVDIVADYRNIPVYSAYKPIDFLGVRWAILAEVDEAEVLASVYQLSRYLILGGAIIVVVIAVLGYLLASDLSTPIVSMTGVMRRLAKNDLTVNVSVTDRKDEVGLMATALIRFKDFALEREQLQQRLSHLAKHDPLTGLPNREFAMSHLDKLIEETEARETSISVMFADLDGFKMINDTYGHQLGDQLLKEVSNRFKYCMRDSDFVARIGGDEFLLILPVGAHVDVEAECADIATKMLNSLKKTFVLSDYPVEVGVSVGSAIYPDDARNRTDLLKLADQAMYQAKLDGKNRYVSYHHDMMMSGS